MEITKSYILFYKTVPDYLARRGAYRSNHLELIQSAYDRKELLIGGALDEPANEAVLVFSSPESAEDFAKNDPYVLNGLIEEWNVRPWNVVIGL